MPDGMRVVAVCRTPLQARVLASRLHGAGIPARMEDSGRQLGERRVEVLVAADQLPRARQIADRLAGRDSPAGLLDVRRLVPALLVLAALVALISFLVDLLV